MPAPPVPPRTAVESCWSAFPHAGPARDLIAALKFRSLLPVASLLAELVAERVPADLLRGELVPVPAAPGRRRRRGFDPAEEIATRLAALTGLPVAGRLARSDSGRQVGRPRTARVADPPRVRAAGGSPPSVVLVDDVQTTGATLSACARALRAAGALRVGALTFAMST